MKITLSTISFSQKEGQKMDYNGLKRYLFDYEFQYDLDYLYIDTVGFIKNEYQKWNVVFYRSEVNKFEDELESISIKNDSFVGRTKENMDSTSIEIFILEYGKNVIFQIDLETDDTSINYVITYLDVDYMILERYSKGFLNVYKKIGTYLLRSN